MGLSKHKNKIILDLCGGTGAWSEPYRQAGYDVRLITLPKNDVRNYKPPKDVYGILAAPPCTEFSFAKSNSKYPRDVRKGMEIVEACLKIIWDCQYNLPSPLAKRTTLQFWALENPYGLLNRFLGIPVFQFHPYQFGDSYKKRTCLWGYFNIPQVKYQSENEIMTKEEIALCHTKFRAIPKFFTQKYEYLKLDRQARRSITPAGFAYAFFKANP